MTDAEPTADDETADAPATEPAEREPVDDDPAQDDPAERERHATNLELYLDLVFVFAVTQVAGFLAGDLTWGGVGRGLLLAWLVWWLWSQFAWLGTAIDLEQRSVAQLLVLAAVPPTLLMAVALPTAFTTGARQFAAAYLVVQLWSLTIQGWSLWGDRANRVAWLGYAPLAALAPTVLLVGAFFDGRSRVVVWTLVALFDVGAALMAARGGSSSTTTWRIDPVHFAERHSLFVIISLGEVLVAAGAAAAVAAGDDLTVTVGVGLVAAVSVACTYWWVYFAFVPRASEWALRRAQGADRGRVARDLFTFGHFPIVTGIVLYAVVAKHLVGAPYEHLHTADLAVLFGSVLCFVGGLLNLQYRNVRKLAPERLAVIAATALWCALAGPVLSAMAVVAGIAVMFLAMQTVTLRRLDRQAAERAATT